MHHETVLLVEAVDALKIRPEGIYVDATFGRGGHSRLILSRLGEKGRLIVCDQDLAAISVAEQEFGKDPRVTIIHDNFGQLAVHLRALGLWGQISGILFDLGVSSPQLEEAGRGFSFLQEGPLDMRMNQTQGFPLSQKIKILEKSELTRILKVYGEEKFAGKIADAILNATLNTTKDLAELIKKAIPTRFHELHKHPATRTFQALRIWINEELSALEKALLFFPEVLVLSGRAVFISFHSLEDRLVKERMQILTRVKAHARGLPIAMNEEDSPSMQVCIKMQKPSVSEVKINPRARSAVLRVMEKVK